MKLESKMKKLTAALLAAGALMVLSGCVDPYYGNAYYGGGFSGSRNGGSGYGYFSYSQPYGGYGYRNTYRNRSYNRRYDRRY